ncbi:hypothetical protein ACQP1G_15780 [Nocardia sp. CA-107356]|uniref:hypothetical protein n=1 Tax=Nocardia sp. CA-107356 TaxID=3239972 RepID=UPI003D8C34FD
MKKRTHAALLALATVSYACSAVITSASGYAAPDTLGDKLCTIEYPTPNDLAIQGSSDAFAASNGNGSIELALHTDAQSETEYYQKFSVAWTNLDTGEKGQAGISAQVRGSDNTLSTVIYPQPGRITLAISILNRGSDQKVTDGNCSAEYTAR